MPLFVNKNIDIQYMDILQYEIPNLRYYAFQDILMGVENQHFTFFKFRLPATLKLFSASD